MDFDSLPEDSAPIASSPQNPQVNPQSAQTLPDFDSIEDDSQKYESTGQQIKASLEGVAQGIAGPLAPLAERALGVKAEDIRGREEANPIISGAGKALGLGAGLFTGTGEAAVMTKAGEAAAGLAGLGKVAEAANLTKAAKLATEAAKDTNLVTEGTQAGVMLSDKALKAAELTAQAKEAANALTYGQKVGAEAVKQAAEMAILQTGDEASKQILNDPSASAETAISNVGLSAMLGGVGGAAMAGVISPLWKATVGDKLTGILGSLRSRLNGESSSALLKEAQDLGLNLKPEVEGALSDDLALRNHASTLRQTDTSYFSRQFQKTENEFRDSVANKMIETLGKTSEPFEVSDAVAGKDIGESLVKEYKSKIDPIIEKLESTKERFSNTALDKDSVETITDRTNPYLPFEKQVISPGTATAVSDKLMQLAQKEEWLTDPRSEEARLIKSTIKDLKNKESLADLVKMGQNIGNKTKSTLPFGMQTPLSRAGAMVRDILRESENSLITKKLAQESPELAETFRGALSNFKDVAKIKDELNDRLKINGSVSGFAKGLAEMAKTDSESLLRKLNGTKDAHLLEFLLENFPETAQKLRDFHTGKIAEKAFTDKGVSAAKIMSGLDKMSPELRDFAVGPDNIDKIQRLNDFLTRLNDHNHNFSNTGRTVDKILSHGGSSALGLIAALSGHAGIGVAVPVAEIVGREGTAATRLAMLKFLGSGQEIKAEGFKSMVDFIHNTYKGENLLSKGTKALFEGGVKTLTEPNIKDREKLNKAVEKFQEKPTAMQDQEQHLGHYLPNHQVAMTEASTRALQYLQSIKPKPYRSSPMDKEIEPSPMAQARYNRALDIAQSPTSVVLNHISDGTIKTTDIKDLTAMYPNLYQQMAKKISAEVISNKNTIPYRTKIGISLFLGQPLDSSMKPSSIMAAQPIRAVQQPMPKSKSNAFEKSNKMYLTQSQAAESDKTLK